MSSDRTLNFKLYPKQYQALTSDANLLLWGGSCGCGKSFMIRAASIIYAIEIPNITVYVFRKNYNDLLANHVNTAGGYLQMLAPMLEDKLVTYNKSDYSFVFVNGSRIQLAHLNNESDLLSYQGREIQVAFIDESTQFTAYSIQFLISRLRLGALRLPEKWVGKIPRCILATNPGGVSHDWHKSRFVDFGTEIHQHPPEWGGMKAQYIPGLLTDNKILIENDPTYADKIRGLSIGSPELVEAMLNGSWDIASSSAFPYWSRKVHVIEPFVIPKEWKIYRGMDDGWSAPYGVLYVAISNGEDFINGQGEWESAPRDSMFVIEEIYGADANNAGLKEAKSETAKRIKAIDETFERLGYRILPGAADSSMWNLDRGKSIAQIFKDEGVNFIKANKRAGSRVQGWNIINQMMYSATLSNPERPYMKLFKNCVNFAMQIPQMQMDSRKREDIDTNANDHLLDCCRYLALQMHDTMQTKTVLGI